MSGPFETPPSRPRWRAVVLVLVAVLALAALAASGVYALAVRNNAGGRASAANVPEDLAPLAELYESLTSQAVDPPDKDKLVRGAIDGMLDQVDDPYATYYPSGDFDDFSASLEGTFSGVGLMLEDTPEGPVIVSVLEGTPAEKAGIQEGERITDVDGENVSEVPLEQIVARVKGEAGTKVRLSLAGGDAGPRELELTRAEFDLPVVESETLDGDIGYVRLFQFTDGSGRRVRQAVRALVEDGVRGIVLDLRGNPGGLLNESVNVASVFIEDGEIVSVEERAHRRQEFEAVDDAFEQVPLAVLVDNSSASASEIVAGAIQDADRGPIVGETTFGKGTVQTIATLSDGSGAKFTTARYYTPSGDSIERIGVEPDVPVREPNSSEAPELEDDPQVQAAVDEVAQQIAARR